jgi:hypothetical protein
MISIIKNLFFDSELVEALKESRVHNSYLHNMLLDGKITLKEYLKVETPTF